MLPKIETLETVTPVDLAKALVLGNTCTGQQVEIDLVGIPLDVSDVRFAQQPNQFMDQEKVVIGQAPTVTA